MMMRKSSPPIDTQTSINWFDRSFVFVVPKRKTCWLADWLFLFEFDQLSHANIRHLFNQDRISWEYRRWVFPHDHSMRLRWNVYQTCIYHFFSLFSFLFDIVWWKTDWLRKKNGVDANDFRFMSTSIITNRFLFNHFLFVLTCDDVWNMKNNSELNTNLIFILFDVFEHDRASKYNHQKINPFIRDREYETYVCLSVHILRDWFFWLTTEDS